MQHAKERDVQTKLAIPVWQDRVSTTVDFARRILIVETDGKREIARKEILLDDGPPEIKARRIHNLGAHVLLCGAISQPLARLVSQAGVRIHPFVAGPVDDVLAAYLCGRLADPRFLQPGCCPAARRRWQHRGGRGGGRKGRR